MTADRARLDAADLLGALNADERLTYGVHLAICRRCRAALAGVSAMGPVSQARWLVSLTRWTAANPRPCHWISLMQAEPRYSR
jgi:anti-sigma factor ChrR (cupin superfamily)